MIISGLKEQGPASRCLDSADGVDALWWGLRPPGVWNHERIQDPSCLIAVLVLCLLKRERDVRPCWPQAVWCPAAGYPGSTFHVKVRCSRIRQQRAFCEPSLSFVKWGQECLPTGLLEPSGITHLCIWWLSSHQESKEDSFWGCGSWRPLKLLLQIWRAAVLRRPPPLPSLPCEDATRTQYMQTRKRTFAK